MNMIAEQSRPAPAQHKADRPHPTSGDSDTIERRLEFMQIEERDLQSIRSLKSIVERELPLGLDKFYAQLHKTPEVSRFFNSEAHIDRAKGAQTGHWSNISSGNFNTDYVANVRTIGQVHARIGLEPRWYIGGYAIVLDHLIQQVVREVFPKKSLIGKRHMEAEEAGKALGNLVKAVMLDMDLAISVYIDEAEAAKQKAQAEAIASERALVSNIFGTAMARIAAKDLTHCMSEDVPDAYQSVCNDFNDAVQQLSETIGRIAGGTQQIRASTGEIQTASEDLAKRTERQAASLEESAASLEEITTTVNDASRRADEAGKLVEKMRDGAQRSSEVVKRAVSAMDAIETSSSEISNIIGVIDSIAFQTNLLALNAGVEAARAGDAGKGFAVVAQEVRELAQRSAQAAREIKTLITNSGEQVRNGVALVGETGQALEIIASEVVELNHHIGAIVQSAREQATALKEINTAIGSMDQATQQNAAMVEQSTAATHSLAGEVSRIVDMVQEFNVADRHRGLAALPEPVSPARPPVSAGTAAEPQANHAPVQVMKKRLAQAFGSEGKSAAAAANWEEF